MKDKACICPKEFAAMQTCCFSLQHSADTKGLAASTRDTSLDAVPGGPYPYGCRPTWSNGQLRIGSGNSVWYAYTRLSSLPVKRYPDVVVANPTKFMAFW